MIFDDKCFLQSVPIGLVVRMRLGSWNILETKTLRFTEWPCCSKMNWFTNESSLTCSSSISSLFPWRRCLMFLAFMIFRIFYILLISFICIGFLILVTLEAMLQLYLLSCSKVRPFKMIQTVYNPCRTCFKAVFNTGFGCSVLCNIYQVTW